MKDKIHFLTFITGLAALIAALASMEKYDGWWSTVVMVVFSLLIPASSLLWRKTKLFSFLLTLFFIIIVVRNADQHDWSLIAWVAAASFIPLLVQAAIVFSEAARAYGNQVVALAFIRIFFGFNLLTHCTEKLFLSQHAQGLVDYFRTVVGANFIGSTLSYQMAVGMIILGGFIELFGAISLGFGLLSRAGALVTALYYIAAQIMGGHFMIGYTWILPGGGWEMLLLMFMSTIPFLLPDTAGKLSLDHHWKTFSWPLVGVFSGCLNKVKNGPENV